MNERIADVLRKSDQIRRMNADLQRDYREAMIRKRSETTAAWFVAHPERAAELRKRVTTKRRATLRQAIANATADELAEIERLTAAWKADPAWLCAYCGKPADAKDRTCDHVTALSRGGEHRASNLKPACRRCNSRKGTKPYYFV